MLVDFEFLRSILAFLCGYFLCLSGSLTQLTTNNGISSPSTLGMDGLAVFFVILTYLVPSQVSSYFSPSHFSFILFTIFTISFFIFILKKPKIQSPWNHLPIQKIIIFGLSFNLFIGAIFSIIQFMFMALNFEFPSSIWFGSLKQYEPSFLYPLISFFVLCLIFVYKKRFDFELMNLGSTIASNIGKNLRNLFLMNLMIATVCTGIVISYFGVFSFLGLVFPHLLRNFNIFRNSFKAEILYGPFLMGFVFMVLDFFAFNILVYGAELPVGMISGVLGSFFLIFLVLRTKAFRA